MNEKSTKKAKKEKFEQKVNNIHQTKEEKRPWILNPRPSLQPIKF